jgi:hypothetical protein
MALAEVSFGSVGIALPILLLAAALLVTAGLYAFRSTPPSVATALVAVGAILGGLGLAWTVLGPISAVVLIVLCTLDARRASASRIG